VTLSQIGLAAAKHRLPKILDMQCTTQVVSDDWSRRALTSATNGSPQSGAWQRTSSCWLLKSKVAKIDKNCQSTASQALENQDGEWAILKSTRRPTGSQWSCRSIGVMWSRRGAPVISINH